jgi:hypothetical protein
MANVDRIKAIFSSAEAEVSALTIYIKRKNLSEEKELEAITLLERIVEILSEDA